MPFAGFQEDLALDQIGAAGVEPASGAYKVPALTVVLRASMWCPRDDSNVHCAASKAAASAVGLRGRWGRGSDLHRGPPHYQCGALLAELQRHVAKAER